MRIIRVRRCRPDEDWGPVKAYFDVEIEDFIIRGFKVTDEDGETCIYSPVNWKYFDVLLIHPDAHEELMKQYMEYKGE